MTIKADDTKLNPKDIPALMANINAKRQETWIPLANARKNLFDALDVLSQIAEVYMKAQQAHQIKLSEIGKEQLKVLSQYSRFGRSDEYKKAMQDAQRLDGGGNLSMVGDPLSHILKNLFNDITKYKPK